MYFQNIANQHQNHKYKTLKMAFITTAVLSLGGLSACTTHTQIETAQIKKLATITSIEGRKVEVLIQGEGAHTIVFEAGLGHDLTIWDAVVDEISPFAKTVRYSRAGYGQSDVSIQPRTLTQIATELDSLLILQGVKPPYILVGHSAGGFYIRKYAELFPEKVSGFIFVDPTPEQILVKLREIDVEKALKDEVLLSSMTPERVQPENIHFSAITQSGIYPKTNELPDVPTVLITAMKQEYPQFLMHTSEGKQAWKTLHTEFVSQFSDYLHIVSNTSGHSIHKNQPKTVTSAIQHIMRRTSTATRVKK